MLDYDLRRDFITDNYGLVGIIFHGIMAFNHVRNNDEQLASQNVQEVCDLEIMRRTKTVLLQICSRTYNIRLSNGQRTIKFWKVFKETFKYASLLRFYFGPLKTL